jgi:hypothetical protein
MSRGIRDNDFPTRPDGSYDRDRFWAETRQGRDRFVGYESAMAMGEQLLLNAVEIPEPPQGLPEDRWRAFVDSLVILDFAGELDPIAEQIAELKDGLWRGREVTDEDLLRYVPTAVAVPDREALAALASTDLHFPFMLQTAGH